MNKRLLTTITFSLFASVCFSQETFEIRKVEYEKIKGAVKLKQPRFITDENGVMLSAEKMGLANPLIYDWNNDGKKDMLIGEFGYHYDSKIKVFENIGSNKKPAYKSEYYYAKDIKGDDLSIYGY